MYYNYNGQASHPCMAISKIGSYLRNHGPQSENTLNLDPPPHPRGRKRVYVQLLEHWSMAKLVLKQSAKARGPLVFEVLRIVSFSLMWEPKFEKASSPTVSGRFNQTLW